MARFLKPLVRSGGYYPSRRWTPLVYPGGYTTANGGEEPAQPPIEKTITGNPIHILDALAKPAQALSVKLEPVQDLNGYSYPWPAGGGKNLLWLNNGIFKTGGFRENRQLTGIGTWVGMSASNYLAPNNIVSYAIGDNSLTVEAKSNGYGIGIECKLTAGQKYTLSWVGTNVYVGISFYDGDGAQLSYVTSGASPKTFTVPESTANAIVVLRADNANVTGEFSNVQLEEGQTATAYSPYANICPISGWTGANVHVADGENPHVVDNVYPVSWQSEAGTVYGGTVDVTTGVLTVTHGQIASYAGESLPGEWISDRDVYSAGGTPTTGAQVVYELATPQTYQLTPTEVTLLLGENNIWSDGEMTLTYLADGNASDEEALNILLGGRYVNNHSEDEPTDREALNIVLGGNER